MGHCTKEENRGIKEENWWIKCKEGPIKRKEKCWVTKKTIRATETSIIGTKEKIKADRRIESEKKITISSVTREKTGIRRQKKKIAATRWKPKKTATNWGWESKKKRTIGIIESEKKATIRGRAPKETRIRKKKTIETTKRKLIHQQLPKINSRNG